MENTYQISGMTCGGCSSHVQKTLSKVDGVNKVDVNLSEKSATIAMDNLIPLEKFKSALADDGGNYGIESL